MACAKFNGMPDSVVAALESIKWLKVNALELVVNWQIDIISKDKDDKLIRIYFYICEKFEELQFYSERFNNNSEQEFTGREIMSTCLYIMHDEGHTKIKHIHWIASELKDAWSGIENSISWGDKIYFINDLTSGY